jgi:hypothetical protein
VYQSIMSHLLSPHRNISTLAPSSLITTILTELAWQPLNRSPWLQGSFNTRFSVSFLISSPVQTPLRKSRISAEGGNVVRCYSSHYRPNARTLLRTELLASG